MLGIALLKCEEKGVCVCVCLLPVRSGSYS